MKTPKEVFDRMCHKHGEIWTRTEKGWSCTRKNEDGSRREDLGKRPPLGVADMLKVSGLTFCYYNGCSGGVELLVSKAQKAKVNQEHSLVELNSEAERLVEVVVGRLETLITRTSCSKVVPSPAAVDKSQMN